MPSLDLSKDREDMLVSELQAKIAKKTGHIPAKSQLTKPMLNSGLAFFSGDFFVTPDRMKPGYPERSTLMDLLLTHAIRVLNNLERYEDSDGKFHLEAYRENELTAAFADGYQPRPLRKPELRELLEAFEEYDDQRGWTA